MMMALEWCTETPSSRYPIDGNDASWVRHVGTPVDTDMCGGNPLGNYPIGSWGTNDWRGARFITETPMDSQPWIYPMAVGYDYSITNSPGEDRCDLRDEFTTSRDQVIAYSVKIPNSREYVSRESAGAEVPRCGVTQRVYTFNRDCGEALAQLGDAIPPGIQLGQVDPNTGATVLATQAGSKPICLLRTKRETSVCPPGFRCTAGGECVGTAGPLLPPLLSMDPEARNP